MSAQVWVGNADLWSTEESLIDDVQKATGIHVKRCWFGIDRQTGKKKNFGFVEFENQMEAAEALRLLGNSIIPSIKSKRFLVNWGAGNKPKNDAEILQKADGYVCYVGNLPNYIDDQKLLEYFRQSFPNAINARIIYNGNVSKGYGFVKFNTHVEVIEAIKRFNNSRDFGHSLRVCEGSKNRIDTQTEASDTKNTTLFVSDLDPTIVDEQILKTNFSVYGTVISVKIDPEKPSWATIKMDSHETAESAKNALQGARFGGMTKCMINWGKSIEESTYSKAQRITAPEIKPQKPTKKMHADFFNAKNVHRIIDYIQQNAEIERKYPIPEHDPINSNAAYGTGMLKSRVMFGTQLFTDKIPEDQQFWFF